MPVNPHQAAATTPGLWLHLLLWLVRTLAVGAQVQHGGAGVGQLHADARALHIVLVEAQPRQLVQPLVALGAPHLKRGRQRRPTVDGHVLDGAVAPTRGEAHHTTMQHRTMLPMACVLGWHIPPSTACSYSYSCSSGLQHTGACPVTAARHIYCMPAVSVHALMIQL